MILGITVKWRVVLAVTGFVGLGVKPALVGPKQKRRPGASFGGLLGFSQSFFYLKAVMQLKNCLAFSTSTVFDSGGQRTISMSTFFSLGIITPIRAGTS